MQCQNSATQIDLFILYFNSGCIPGIHSFQSQSTSTFHYDYVAEFNNMSNVSYQFFFFVILCCKINFWTLKQSLALHHSLPQRRSSTTPVDRLTKLDRAEMRTVSIKASNPAKQSRNEILNQSAGSDKAKLFSGTVSLTQSNHY
jgi:hypothetical protein